MKSTVDTQLEQYEKLLYFNTTEFTADDGLRLRLLESCVVTSCLEEHMARGVLQPGLGNAWCLATSRNTAVGKAWRN